MKKKNGTKKQRLLNVLMVVTMLFGMAMSPSKIVEASPSFDAAGFDLTPVSNSKSGPPGTSATYTFTITNNVDSEGIFTISCEGGSASCSTSLTVGASTSGTFDVTVPIPSSAFSGDEISTLIIVVDSRSSEQENATLKTIAFIPQAPTETPTPFRRPLVSLDSYSAGNDAITPGNDFTLTLNMKNSGPTLAGNVILSFVSSDFLPLDTGGVRTIAELGAGKTTTISQPMRANFSMWGYDSGSVTVNVSYTDVNGTGYSETFTLTINLKTPNYTAPTPTPTPGPKSSAQLVVDTYNSDIDPLQPGTIFQLSLFISNMGLDTARKVTMVLGGGVDNVQPGTDGSTQGNGLSGGSADLTNFGPMGSSNIIFLDNINAGESFETSVQLIVNVTTQPGAYPFKISFVYEDAEGKRVVDDQVITLLVYRLPSVDINFYRDPGILFAGQPSPLPLQITNMGKTTAILGNMTVTADTAQITENTLMVGSLEPGGYFTMDANAWPMVEGPMTIIITVNYTDDFNQSRVVEQTLVLNVEPMPVYETPPEGEYIDPSNPGMNNGQPETFWQQVWRFILGLLGLDSGQPQQEITIPTEEIIPEQPIVVPGGKG